MIARTAQPSYNVHVVRPTARQAGSEACGDAVSAGCVASQPAPMKQEPTEATQDGSIPRLSAVGISSFQAGEDVNLERGRQAHRRGGDR